MAREAQDVVNMTSTSLIAAVGTPLTPDEKLHSNGLMAHLRDCRMGGLNGILAAGTMGLMQLLTDSTYRALVECSVSSWPGPKGLFIGAGDTSLARTREKISFLNRFQLEGVVVLPPYFVQFDQAELLVYFRTLADESHSPIYLYDLPGRTRTKLALDTVERLAQHPNVAGIKASGDVGYARQLRDRISPPFRVIVAVPEMLDVLLRCGFHEHLDGMFALAPHWTSAIDDHVRQGEWEQAAGWQRKLTSLRDTIVRFGVVPAFTALMNARGVPGDFSPRPHRRLSRGENAKLLAEPVVKALLREVSGPIEDVPVFA